MATLGMLGYRDDLGDDIPRSQAEGTIRAKSRRSHLKSGFIIGLTTFAYADNCATNAQAQVFGPVI